jgi:outer membrane protein assembly factor BamB
VTRVFGRKLVDLASGTVRNLLAETPASIVQDERTVCTLREGRLRSVGLIDGVTKWEATLRSPSKQLTIDAGDVFVASEDRLDAFDANDGRRREIVTGEKIDRFVVSGDTVAARTAKGDVLIAGRDGSPRARVAASPADRLANGTDHLLEGHGRVPAILLEALEHRFLVKGLAADGSIAWHTEIEHSEMLSRDTSSGMYFFLNFETSTPHHLLFTSHWSTFRRPATVVLRSADGTRAADIERHISALVETDSGALNGMLCVDQVKSELIFLEPGTSGKIRWAVRSPSAAHRRADVALCPAGLVVAQYDAIAPGARLVLLDPTTGLTRWQADVEDRPRYERTPLFVNAWSVSVAGDRVVLTGDESAGTSAQIFDLADGRRIFSDLNV